MPLEAFETASLPDKERDKSAEFAAKSTTAMKQSALADTAEVAKLEQYASEVLSKTIQNPNFTVRKSIF